MVFIAFTISAISSILSANKILSWSTTKLNFFILNSFRADKPPPVGNLILRFCDGSCACPYGGFRKNVAVEAVHMIAYFKKYICTVSVTFKKYNVSLGRCEAVFAVKRSLSNVLQLFFGLVFHSVSFARFKLSAQLLNTK